MPTDAMDACQHRDKSPPISDELAIRWTIERYFYAIDAKDRPALESCFSGAVEVRYHVGTEGEFRLAGIDAVVSYLFDNMRDYVCRTHAMANCHVVVLDGEASAVTHATASVWKGSRIYTRGLRYTDNLVRDRGEWRISRRLHQPLWQHEAESTPFEVPTLARAVAARST
jgi:hypothetical protein